MYVLPNKVVPSTLLERENRFIIWCKYQGQKIRCYLPNPGRMEDILTKGKTVFIQYHNNSNRKTDATALAVSHNKQIINLYSDLVRMWLPIEFQNKTVPGLIGWKMIKQEVTYGNHRFDYLLNSPNNTQYVCEVKSTNRVDNNTACFPDGVSKRATDHLKHLQTFPNGIIIFIVQQKAERFKPCRQIDPKFALELNRAAENGVKLLAIESEMELINSKLQIQLLKTIPIEL